MFPKNSPILGLNTGEISGKFWGIGPQMVPWKKVPNYVYWVGAKDIGIRNISLRQKLNSFIRIRILKYQKATTPAYKDIEIRKL